MGLTGFNGGVDLVEFEKLKKQLEQSDKDITVFMEACSKELATRLLRLAIKRTPVGIYGDEYINKKGKKRQRNYKSVNFETKEGKSVAFKAKTIKTGGTLRRGWLGQVKGSGAEGLASSNATKYAQSLKIYRFGGSYVILITNSTDYASYVEFGHRGRGGKGWVKGQSMLTLSEDEVRRAAPKILEAKIKKLMGEIMK